MEHFINIESNVVKRRKTTSALRCGCTLFSHYVGRRRRPRLFSHPLLGEARIMAAHARQGKVMQGKATQRNATHRSGLETWTRTASLPRPKPRPNTCTQQANPASVVFNYGRNYEAANLLARWWRTRFVRPLVYLPSRRRWPRNPRGITVNSAGRVGNSPAAVGKRCGELAHNYKPAPPINYALLRFHNVNTCWHVHTLGLTPTASIAFVS